MTDLITQGAFEFGERELIVHGQPSLDEYIAAFGETQNLWLTSQERWPWILGDFIVYGERSYGERYPQAIIEMSDRSLQTLMNYASLCRAYPPERRRPGISASLHDAVKALPEPEQDHWLDVVEEQGWVREDLRAALNASKALGDGNSTAGGMPDIRRMVQLTMAELALLMEELERNQAIPDELYQKFEQAYDRCEAAIENAQRAMERGESNG